MRGCSRCGESNPVCLELHHLDGKEKDVRLRTHFNPETQTKWMPGWGNLSYSDIVDEIKKCEVLCANCHRKLERKHEYPPNLEKKSPKLIWAEKQLGLGD
jgi:hypothetical protein